MRLDGEPLRCAMPGELQFSVWGQVLKPRTEAGVEVGYCSNLRSYRPRPAGDSGRRPYGAAKPSPSSPIRSGRPSGPKRPEIQTHHFPTCRPRACRALPPPGHFVDMRTHLRGLGLFDDCLVSPVFLLGTRYTKGRLILHVGPRGGNPTQLFYD